MVARLNKINYRLISSVWVLYALVLLLAAGIAWSQAGAALDNWVLDSYWRWQNTHTDKSSANDPVLIGIDEKFMEQIDVPIALIHEHLATLLYGLGKVAPRAVGLDIVLPEKRYDTLMSTQTDGMDYHKTLLKALMSPDTAFPLMIAKTWDHERSQFRDIMPDYAVALSMREQPSSFVSSLFCADKDGFVRHSPGKQCQPSGEIGLSESLHFVSIESTADINGLINFGEGPAWDYLPVQTVLGWIAQNDVPRLTKEFAGRTVLVGTVLRDTDVLKSPVMLLDWPSLQHAIPGMIIHAQILRSLANNSFIQELPATAVSCLVLLASFGWFGESSRRKYILVACVGLALPVIALLLLKTRGYWLPFMSIGLMLMLSALLRGMYDGVNHYLTHQRLKSTFGGYVSPSVLTQITSGKISADREGVSVHLCVLFSDIRGFTTLSEKYPPKVIVDILNRYFDRMTSIVHKHHGTVDKFIGDGLMAFFGAPNVLANPEQHAVAAGEEMRAALVEFNVEMVSLGYPELGMGVGLHSGEAIVGNVGAKQRHAYTAIGDTVNTASRLESLCKSVGYGLVCSGDVYRAIGKPAGWIELGEQPLKGRAAMEVFGWEQSRS